MNILSELRSIKRQVIALQENQKEGDRPFIACSGSPITQIDPAQRLSLLEMEIEKLYGQLIEVQADCIKTKNRLDENNY